MDSQPKSSLFGLNIPLGRLDIVLSLLGILSVSSGVILYLRYIENPVEDYLTIVFVLLLTGLSLITIDMPPYIEKYKEDKILRKKKRVLDKLMLDKEIERLSR